MDTKHTPGPWSYGEDMNTHVIRGANEKRMASDGVTEYEWRDYVASMWGGPNEANARLIAAAPEMLQALILAAEALGGSTDTTLLGRADRAVSAAIARATGAA